MKQLQLHSLIIGLVLGVTVCSLYAQDGNYKVQTVVIDAGHGGHDPGCQGKNSKEKHITLAIALKLGEYIEKYLPDVKVIYTRTTDKFVELHERAAIANRNNADVFISIHCNAINHPATYGTETYVMGLHVSEENLKVAMRENEVVLLEEDYKTHYDGFDPNSPEAHIIFSLYQNAHLEQSINLATKIEQQFKERAKRRSRGVKQAGFLVLYKTTMPSVLIETGFLTNSAEEQYLMSESGQAYIASAIYRALKEYKMEYESRIASHQTSNTSEATGTASGETTGGEKTDETLVYRIQIAASTRPLPGNDPLLEGLEDVVEEVTESGMYRYLTGAYTSIELAENQLRILRNGRFPDAFIVAYRNGQRLSFDEVTAILKNSDAH